MGSARSRVSQGEVTQDTRELGSRSSRAPEPAKAVRAQKATSTAQQEDDGCCKTCKGRHCVGDCRF
jgi:hypothetical protein